MACAFPEVHLGEFFPSISSYAYYEIGVLVSQAKGAMVAETLVVAVGEGAEMVSVILEAIFPALLPSCLPFWSQVNA